MSGLKAVAFFSNAEIIHVESPRQDAELNPPSYRETAFAMNLEHNSNPETSNFGILKPVLRGVTRALAARICDSN